MFKMASSRSRTNSNLSKLSAAYKALAVLEGTRQSLAIFRDFWREEGAMPIDKRGDTILHFLAIYGNVDAFTLLLRNQERFVTNEDLKIKNVNGDTALHEAARFGQKDVAEIIVRREKDLVFERNNLGETPLYVAAARGNKDVFTFLAKSHSNCLIRRNDGCTILHAAVMGECFGLAINILELHPELAGKRNEKGWTALHLLAAKPESFRSGSPYMFKDVGWRTFILVQIIGAIIYSCIPESYKESPPLNSAEDPQDNAVPISILKRSSFTKFILSNPWFKEIDDTKQKHIVAVRLAKRLIIREDWSHYVHTKNQDLEGSQFGIPSEKKIRVPDPLIQATRLGINEVALEILKVYPEAADTFDENGKNILHIVVEQKHRFLYDDFMVNIVHKDRMLNDVDYQGNSIMHLAAKLGSPPRTPPGVLHQMMWGILWFKRVKYDSYPFIWHLQNSNGNTARQEFSANHANTRKDAEKTLKEMANGVMIVSVLIASINFAAVFTVPGGFDQKTGEPIYLKNQNLDFDLLFTYLAAGLLSSLFTVGTLLAIIFSRFENDDFHVALPLKYVITIITLFYSTGATILACAQAYLLEGILERISTALLILIFSCLLIAVVYMDISFLMYDYMYYVICYSFSYSRR